ncbi:DegT/DnrJ/EryC1/StrS family aminotransferase [Microbacterium terregens]|uniref:DegT/DnrJ/EryC1/StrS family aminotransferase n=1 Tax=Microbacterium terregens TaxID=69363 RepID=A0ABV5SZN1_9MICO
MTEQRRVPFNDLARGMTRDRDALLDATAAVVDSGYAVLGAQHAAFERELAAYLRAGDAVGVANGTDALELAIKAVMPQGRSVVLTAGNAGAYTSTATVRAGYTPRYADVDPQTLCLTVATVSDALTDAVGVVVVTHLYGYLGDAAALRTLCDERGVALVEDCAQAIGAVRPDGHASTFGHAGTFSFYPTKNLGAIGDGGAVVPASPEIAARVRQLRQYGWDGKYNAALTGGTNSRLDELQAAFLRIRLPLVDGFNQRRRDIIARYRDATTGLDPELLTVLPADGVEHAAHLAIARSSRRDNVRAQLAGAGIPTDIHFPLPDWEQPAFARFAPQQDLPSTTTACVEILSLPLFPELTDGEVETVSAAIRSLT